MARAITIATHKLVVNGSSSPRPTLVSLRPGWAHVMAEPGPRRDTMTPTPDEAAPTQCTWIETMTASPVRATEAGPKEEL